MHSIKNALDETSRTRARGGQKKSRGNCTVNHMLLYLFFLSLLCNSGGVPAPGVVATMAFTENATLTYSHCSSFVQLPGGVILAVFQASSSSEGAPTQEKYLVRSTDGGRSWMPPSVLVPNSNISGVVTLPWDGTVFIDTAFLVRYVYASSSTMHFSAGDLFTISSGDEGASWSAPTLVVPNTVWNRSMSNINPPVRLPDGALGLPVDTVPGKAGERGPVTSGLVIVGGDGELWTPLGIIPSPELGNISTYLEPAVAACAPPLDNQLLALLRTNIGELWSARSTDSGASWSVAFRTPFQNPDSKVNLLQWSGPGAGGGAPADGDLVLALNPFSSCNNSAPYCPRTPLSLTVSRDCGGSWGPLYDVEVDAGDHWGYGYPTAQQCTDQGGEPAICLTYTVTSNGTGHGGIRYSVVPAANLI
jgi:hypothetical protein